jgi:DMSO/TMAO reductase YedYZ molybdopterin-dependent catalytic subunit
MHYLLNHFDVPYVEDEAAWRLSVTGHVARALSLSMGEIKALPARTLRVTLECAGNGRGQMTPRWPSMPWMSEAVGTGAWTGAPLKSVLEAAGLKPGAIDVSFTGIDRGFDKGNEHEYGRSLRVQQALDEDVLLVYGMNGQPLLPQHGFPLRLIVPGWYGMASVKWLRSIELIDHEFTGYQNAVAYRIRQDADDPGVAVTRIEPRALLIPPGSPDFMSRHRFVTEGPVVLQGRAWSGWAPIERVEVSVDAGVSWQDAKLDAESNDLSWRGFSFDWNAVPGEHVLTVRAHDRGGRVQPIEAPWNRGGFANNSAQRITVLVL